ncbi:UNVERIFIED_CONTAM: hypothetical protein FKN15_000958 [Acipenser sinensis]
MINDLSCHISTIQSGHFGRDHLLLHRGGLQHLRTEMGVVQQGLQKESLTLNQNTVLANIEHALGPEQVLVKDQQLRETDSLEIDPERLLVVAQVVQLVQEGGRVCIQREAQIPDRDPMLSSPEEVCQLPLDPGHKLRGWAQDSEPMPEHRQHQLVDDYSPSPEEKQFQQARSRPQSRSNLVLQLHPVGCDEVSAGLRWTPRYLKLSALHWNCWSMTGRESTRQGSISNPEHLFQLILAEDAAE